MAEQLLCEDPQNCTKDDYKVNCQDINGGDYKRTICDVLPNNNVFVSGDTPCYNSESDFTTNNTNNASVRMENTPTSSSPASGVNPYSNSSTPANFGESDTYSESSQGNTQSM